MNSEYQLKSQFYQRRTNPHQCYNEIYIVLRSPMKRFLVLLIVAIILPVAVFRHFSQPTPSSYDPVPEAGQLRVHFIDVGQGDGILVEGADGTTVLIDGGYNNGMA